MKMKFWQLPKQERANMANRIIQLRRNLEKYQYQVANLTETLAAAQYQVDKTDKELNKILISFEDSDEMPA